MYTKYIPVTLTTHHPLSELHYFEWCPPHPHPHPDVSLPAPFNAEPTLTLRLKRPAKMAPPFFLFFLICFKTLLKFHVGHTRWPIAQGRAPPQSTRRSLRRQPSGLFPAKSGVSVHLRCIRCFRFPVFLLHHHLAMAMGRAAEKPAHL